MTPQERELVTGLFDRLASLESTPRDPDAERAVAQGLARAPHALYALVQTALVQDEALKRAYARIQELEGGEETPRGGFLDSMRDALMGRERPQGSVPSIRPDSKWNSGGVQRPAEAAPVGSGNSFLGTAAAAAAGVIGGSLLFNAIQSMLGGQRGAAFAGQPDLDRHERSPWGSDAANSDLARDAGVNDVPGASRYDGRDHRAGLFDNADADDTDDDGDEAFDSDDFGGGDISDA